MLWLYINYFEETEAKGKWRIEHLSDWTPMPSECDSYQKSTESLRLEKISGIIEPNLKAPIIKLLKKKKKSMGLMRIKTVQNMQNSVDSKLKTSRKSWQQTELASLSLHLYYHSIWSDEAETWQKMFYTFVVLFTTEAEATAEDLCLVYEYIKNCWDFFPGE